MCDLEWSEHDLLVADHEMRADIAVGATKLLGRHKRNDDPSRRASEPVGLDDDHEWYNPVVPAGVPVDT
jgi:hypothetical protein